jgi:hypothetical protein
MNELTRLDSYDNIKTENDTIQHLLNQIIDKITNLQIEKKIKERYQSLETDDRQNDYKYIRKTKKKNRVKRHRYKRKR